MELDLWLITVIVLLLAYCTARREVREWRDRYWQCESEGCHEAPTYEPPDLI